MFRNPCSPVTPIPDVLAWRSGASATSICRVKQLRRPERSSIGTPLFFFVATQTAE
jgi:hypothetical protein